MDATVILAYLSALFAFALAVSVPVRGDRSLPHWCFSIGMAALAVESVCYGFAADAFEPLGVLLWERWGLVAMSVVPGAWLLFGFTYSRGTYQEYLRRWRFALGLACAAQVPWWCCSVGAGCSYRRALLESVNRGP